MFSLKLDGEGTFECTATGLIFEVTRAVTIEYSVLSWTKYAAYVKDPWIVVGPIFDIKCTSSVLTSIQFPHTLCLNGKIHCKYYLIYLCIVAHSLESSNILEFVCRSFV